MNLLIYINGHRVCPDCLNDTFITDLFHAESYCSKCGLIVRDNSIPTRNVPVYLTSKIAELKKIAPTYDIHY